MLVRSSPLREALKTAAPVWSKTSARHAQLSTVLQMPLPAYESTTLVVPAGSTRSYAAIDAGPAPWPAYAEQSVYDFTGPTYEAAEHEQ